MFISKSNRPARILVSLSLAAGGSATLGTSTAFACHSGLCGGRTVKVSAHTERHLRAPGASIARHTCSGGNCGQRATKVAGISTEA